MQYRRLAKYIKKKEIKVLLSAIYPEAELRYFKRRERLNYVEVYFEDARREQIRQVDFLPDDIYVYRDDEKGDGIAIENGDILYRYNQFMIAKGYSDLWKDNPYML